MFSLPKQRLTGVLVALAVAAFALASCGGGGTSLPPTPGGGGGAPQPSSSASAVPTAGSSGTPSPAPTATPTTRPTAPPTAPPTTRPTASPTAPPTIAPQSCPVSQVPGTYTSVIAVGNVNIANATFTASAGSIWNRAMYTLATPAPTPTGSFTPAPSPSPTTTPSPQPVFIYQGTYTVTVSGKTETTGCALLVTSQDGSPLNGTPFSGSNTDFPNFNVLTNAAPVANGTVSSMTISNLSANGGSGPFTLSDGSSGTVTLTSRTAFPSLSAAQFLLHHR